jgi:LacI family repressor for deo operon, udp, cdd, tsx, nupC, and nupG
VAVTLRDVAQHAGVAPRTVSNVVNNYPYVSEKMRTKVQASLDELNYKPNLMARSLRQGRTGNITLLLPYIAVPYFGEIAHEVVEYASPLGCTVLIDETGGQTDRELALLDIAARSGWVDGVLLSSQGLHGRALADVRTNVPIVLLGERTAKTTMDHVGIDNVKAAGDAARHLLQAGCTRIAAIGGNPTPADMTSRLRLKGYRGALRAAGLPDDDALYVQTPGYGRGDAAAAVRQLLASGEPPDGIFCFSDELAVGVVRELYEQGIPVPQQMKIVGFDDIDETRFSVPTISSIRPDKPAIAMTALNMLLERVEGTDVNPRDVRVGHQLIPRESSAS